MAAKFPTVAMFLGDESIGRKRAETSLVDSVFAGASPSFNLATFSAAEGAERALEVVKTVPMMAEYRVVVIREMESASVSLLDDLLNYVGKPNPSTVLILTGVKTPAATGGVDRGRRIEGAVKRLESGRVERFKTGEQDPIRFAVKAAEEGGCTLGHRSASMLVEFVGSDLGRIQNELGKLIAFVGGAGEIDGVAIEAVCSLVAEAAIWDLTDAVVRRDPDRALAVAHRMLETGESSHRLIGMIAWQMRQLITLQDCLGRSVNPRDAGIRMPRYKLEAATDMIRNRPIHAARILDQIATANAGLNSSRAGDRRVFEGLLLQLTT
jgi:DNA polymerase-3 subunit delta